MTTEEKPQKSPARKKPERKGEKNTLFKISLKDMQHPGFVGTADIRGVMGQKAEIFFATQYSQEEGQQLIIRVVKDRADLQSKKAAKRCETVEEVEQEWAAFISRKLYYDEKNRKKKEKREAAKETAEEPVETPTETSTEPAEVTNQE